MKQTTRDSGSTAPERMTDAELSEKLGHYQKMSSVWLLIGLLAVAAGVVSFFAFSDPALKGILTAILFFGGIACALFFGGGAQKKIKTLMQEQLGDFFRAELEGAFGAEFVPPEMQIDGKCLKKFCIADGEWEESEVENFHEAAYRGVRFSAANVRLIHVYERAVRREELESRRETVFQGLVLCCKTRRSAPSPICVRARTDTSPRGIVTDNETFDRLFCVTAEHGEDALFLLTPQFMELLIGFGESIEGRIVGILWEGNTFSMALETDYGFAAVAGSVDLRDIDAVRSSYRNSLREMGETLDLLFRNSALFAAEE